jgi:hypothetical protein
MFPARGNCALQLDQDLQLAEGPKYYQSWPEFN